MSRPSSATVASGRRSGEALTRYSRGSSCPSGTCTGPLHAASPPMARAAGCPHHARVHSPAPPSSSASAQPPRRPILTQHLPLVIHERDPIGDVLENRVQLLRLRLRRTEQPAFSSATDAWDANPKISASSSAVKRPGCRVSQQQSAPHPPLRSTEVRPGSYARSGGRVARRRHAAPQRAASHALVQRRAPPRLARRLASAPTVACGCSANARDAQA